MAVLAAGAAGCREPLAAVAEHAPAKVNLALHVTGQRADGYHLLESLSVFTAFGDRISVAAADPDSLVISGPFARDVPESDGNLVTRARDAFRSAFGHTTSQPLAIALEKNIPAVSGVGGGSADAAATLRALGHLFGVARDRLTALATPLGADVPMCLAGTPLVARGIGEHLTPVVGFPVLHMVLANPGAAVSTPQAFAGLRNKSNPHLPPLPARVDAKTLVEWLKATRNDLLEPARRMVPAIGEAIDALIAEGAAFARMSGSGATCFGLFADAASAHAAAAAISRARPDWFVIATHSTASAP